MHRANPNWPSRPKWRGARPKLENEDFARARPVEGGKPGLSGRCRAWVWKSASVLRNELRLYPLTARDGGFGARSGIIAQ